MSDCAHYKYCGADCNGPSQGAITRPHPARVADCIKKIEAERDSLRAIIGSLLNTYSRILDELKARRWITEGRGSYRYDDDRYREETGFAFDAIRSLVEEALARARKDLEGKK